MNCLKCNSKMFLDDDGQSLICSNHPICSYRYYWSTDLLDEKKEKARRMGPCNSSENKITGNNPYMVIGQIIRQGREAKGMSMAELSVRLCKTKDAIAGYEHGRIQPRINVAMELENILGISLTPFFKIDRRRRRKAA